MSQPYPESSVFLPNGKATNVVFFWAVPVILAILIQIQSGVSLVNIIVGIIVIGICSIDILPYKKNISVTISPGDNTLVFTYNNCWGQERLIVVDLNSASVSFKYRLLNLNYRLFGKFKLGWRLRLYNGSYFNNRIVIKQDDEIGYSKTQLDEMVLLINQCTGKESSELFTL